MFRVVDSTVGQFSDPVVKSDIETLEDAIAIAVTHSIDNPEHAVSISDEYAPKLRVYTYDHEAGQLYTGETDTENTTEPVYRLRDIAIDGSVHVMLDGEATKFFVRNSDDEPAFLCYLA